MSQNFRDNQLARLHIKEIAKHIDSGLFQMGGATLHSPPKDGKLNISGSAIIARANSVEEVLEVLKQDIYYRSGVWDFDKIQIHPVRVSFYILTWKSNIQGRCSLNACIGSQSKPRIFPRFQGGSREPGTRSDVIPQAEV